MKFIQKIQEVFLCVTKAFDIRDFLVFGGLSMLGYGLYLREPWIAFSVCGVLSMALGLGWMTRVMNK